MYVHILCLLERKISLFHKKKKLRKDHLKKRDENTSSIFSYFPNNTKERILLRS